MEILGNTLLHRTHVSSAVKDRKGAGVTPAWCLDVSLSMCASVTNRRVSWVKSRGSWVTRIRMRIRMADTDGGW